MANPSRRAKHHDTTFRSVVLSGGGNDDWQRQADAAAWSAVSGMSPALYLGGIEPIPVPAALKAQMREAGRALAAEPSQVRADALLRLAHEAVYGHPAPGAPLAASPATAGASEGGDWWETPGEAEKPLSAPVGGVAPLPGNPALLEAAALEAFAALQAAEPDPEGAGEAPDQPQGDWWE